MAEVARSKVVHTRNPTFHDAWRACSFLASHKLPQLQQRRVKGWESLLLGATSRGQARMIRDRICCRC